MRGVASPGAGSLKEGLRNDPRCLEKAFLRVCKHGVECAGTARVLRPTKGHPYVDVHRCASFVFRR